MEKTLKVAVSEKIIETKEVVLDYPQVTKYYKKFDDGIFFPRGEILFAIIPKCKNSTFLLVEVERGKQDYNDFVPTKDCRDSFWIKGGSIRHTAFDIITSKNSGGFTEISKEEFDLARVALLDCYKEFETNTYQP